MKLFVQAGPHTADGVEHKRIEKHLRQFARPDTEITVRDNKYYSPMIATSRYAQYLQLSERIEAAIQAEREGYDAIVLLSTLDLGVFEIREAVEIPVIFSIETSLHVATLLAPKVTFLALNRSFLDKLHEMAKLYGLHERLTPGGYFSLGAGEVQLAFKNPAPVIQKLEAEARKIAEQGANILICTNFLVPLLLIENRVTELSGMRVLDSLGVLIKTAEMMVDLHKMGMNRDKMGLYAPLPKEKLREIRKAYEVE